MFGSSKNKAEKGSTYAPLHSCDLILNNLPAVVKPSEDQVYRELGSCKTTQANTQICDRNAKAESWTWNECGCAGACWHGKSASYVTASSLSLATDQLILKYNRSQPRRAAPLSNSPVTEPIKLEDFLKKFKGTGTCPKTHMFHLRPEIIMRKLKKLLTYSVFQLITFLAISAITLYFSKL